MLIRWRGMVDAQPRVLPLHSAALAAAVLLAATLPRDAPA